MGHRLSRRYCKPKADMKFMVGGIQYRLAGMLGDGAVGVVRKAKRLDDGRAVAIKFLAPDPKYIDEAVFDDVAERFRREGMRGAQMAHPHLVTIYAYEHNDLGAAFEGSGPNNPFIAMELVRGRSLESFIRKTPEPERGKLIPERQRLEIAIHVARALEYFHEKRIVHRDVKPANIFLTTLQDPTSAWYAKLGDFGVVKWGDFNASLATGVLTATNQQGLGTLKYMAPEQAINPKEVGVASDIFSLGITLLELLSGQILNSPHHVFGVMSARLQRNMTTSARYKAIGIDVPSEFADLGELILDMHLRGARGRPPIKKVLGHLKYQYSALFGEEAKQW